MLPAVAIVLAFPATGAQASACKQMSVEGTLVSLSISPSATQIFVGGCVQFFDKTTGPGGPVTVLVGQHYKQQLPPGGRTSGSTNYVGTTPGSQQVTATKGPSTTANPGTITVKASPSPSPSRSPSSPPSPQHTSSPQPTSSGTGPQVAPTPSTSPTVGGAAPPPRLPTPSPAATGTPTPTSSPTPAPAATAVLTGPVERGNGRGVGLPAALAAFAVVGAAGALVRVLLAEPDGPVDDGRTVPGSA
jgi:hypothetical protein